LLDELGLSDVVRVKEALESGAAGLAGGFGGRPALEEVAEQRAVLVGKPLKRLREVVLQGAGDAIGDAGLIIDQTAALQRTVTRRRGRGASASFHCARAPRWLAPRAAAELRR